MSQIEKLLKRFLSRPTDFTYAELKKLLSHFGYDEASTGKTSGSAAEFINRQTKHVIKIHKPHPRPILKHYQLEEVEERLRNQGVIK